MFHVSLSHSIVVLGTLAVGRALKFSLEIGISSAILEGDMEIVLNAIKKSSPSVASFSLLIQNTKIVGEYFYSVIFSHIRKNGNSVVYNFARVHLK